MDPVFRGNQELKAASFKGNLELKAANKVPLRRIFRPPKLRDLPARSLSLPNVRTGASSGLTNIEWPTAINFEAEIGKAKIIQFIEKVYYY